MSAYPAKRFLFDVQSRQLADAEIYDQITDDDIAEWKAEWKPKIDSVVADLRRRGVARHLWPQSHHWNWEQKAPSMSTLCEHGYAVRCQGRLQGLMLVNSVSGRCQLPGQEGRDCLYIDFIESAPWNQVQYTSSPRFSLVGSVLVAAAVHQSIQEGFKGRFSLHSLGQSDNWYSSRLGMTDMGLDPTRYQGRLRYFEATTEAANAILNGVEFP